MSKTDNTFTTQAKKKVRAFIKAGSMSCYRLTMEAGIDKNALRNVHSDSWNPKADTLAALEKVIDSQ